MKDENPIPALGLLGYALVSTMLTDMIARGRHDDVKAIIGGARDYLSRDAVKRSSVYRAALARLESVEKQLGLLSAPAPSETPQ